MHSSDPNQTEPISWKPPTPGSDTPAPPWYIPRGPYGWKTLAAMTVWALVVIPAVLWVIYPGGIMSLFNAPVKGALIFWMSCLSGLALQLIARDTGCRSQRGLNWTALLIGLWSLYLSWVFWLPTFHGLDIYVWNPVKIWRALLFIASDGVWEVRGRIIGPGVTLFLWGIEALIIVFIPRVVGRRFFSRNPFCNHCRQWLEPVAELPLKEPPYYLNDLAGLMREGRVGELALLPPAVPDRLLVLIRVFTCRCDQPTTVVIVCAIKPRYLARSRRYKIGMLRRPVLCSPQAAESLIRACYEPSSLPLAPTSEQPLRADRPDR